ncbi:MAG: hypothetical protein N3D11_11995 [Candidatus Sumerlaeia bacterium]|nr:hypothetical protein [Candidatus Sumerlaeia bacterium]
MTRRTIIQTTSVLLAICMAFLATHAAEAESQLALTSPSGTAAATSVFDGAASVPLVPKFDIWADQPRLNCALPAIRAWQVVRHVHAQTDLAPSSPTAAGAPQIIFAQRPGGPSGRSKYSVIYQRTQQSTTTRDAWYRIAASFYIGFLDEVRRGGDYAKIEATSPIVVMSGDVQRVYFTYWFERKDGSRVGGAAVSAPARGGVLFYNLTLEGATREVLDAAMDELRRQVTRGLAMPTRSLKPYIIGVLLLLPLGVFVIVGIRRLRARPAT